VHMSSVDVTACYLSFLPATGKRYRRIDGQFRAFGAVDGNEYVLIQIYPSKDWIAKLRAVRSRCILAGVISGTNLYLLGFLGMLCRHLGNKPENDYGKSQNHCPNSEDVP